MGSWSSSEAPHLHTPTGSRAPGRHLFSLEQCTDQEQEREATGAAGSILEQEQDEEKYSQEEELTIGTYQRRVFLTNSLK